jgi:hypothetical protein
MPTCVSVNSTTDFTTTALAGPDDGYSFSIAQATPTPTATDAPTPTPTPTETPAPTSTPTPTPTATSGGGGGALPAGGADCDNTLAWPTLTTKYQVTFTTSGVGASEEWFEQAGADTKKLYMSVVGDPTTAIGGSVRIGMATDGTPPCFADVMTTKNGSDLLLGVLLNGALSGKFYIKAQLAGAVGTWDIWLE